MKKRIVYTDEPLIMGEEVLDFLPQPSHLVKRKSTTKITMDISCGSLSFFKKHAKHQRVPYQRMPRSLIDAYVAHCIASDTDKRL